MRKSPGTLDIQRRKKKKWNWVNESRKIQEWPIIYRDESSLKGPIYHLSNCRELMYIIGHNTQQTREGLFGWRNKINEIQRHHILSRTMRWYPGEEEEEKQEDREIDGDGKSSLNYKLHGLLYWGHDDALGWNGNGSPPGQRREEWTLELISQSIMRNNWISRWQIESDSRRWSWMDDERTELGSSELSDCPSLSITIINRNTQEQKMKMMDDQEQSLSHYFIF